ncbi:TRAP transporter substrate-binding protein [Nesterenkonia rhizosphaerae]|uniref:TRAP transporter substrate-binding protein n=1 Tax=Nesterenkonia rhizosphaerae TaxID=1348272 RepID=A0ABP9FN82_9MICC
MTKPRFTAAAAVIACTLGLTATGCTYGLQGTPETGKTMIFALDQAEDHPSYIALEAFSDRLEDATDGRWDIRVYPNAALGNQQETVQLVSEGSVDMVVASGTLLENLNRDFRTLALPLLYEDIDHQMAVLSDEEILGDLFTSLEEPNNLTVLGGFTQGERHVYTKNGPFTEPDDLNGQKIRVQESDLMIDMLSAMGSNPTPLSYAEVYTAIQSGVLDGAENNLISYMTTGHNVVAPHVALTAHQVGTDYVVINSEVFTGMTEEDRQTFLQEWQATVDHHTQMWVELTEEAADDAEAQGSTFTEVDQQAFTDGLAEMLEDELADPEVRELFDRIQNYEG